MVARLVVLIAAVGAGIFGAWRGTWAAGGSDSSCYALMADAFARGELQPATTLAAVAPWPDSSRTFAPGGFIPSPRRTNAASPICSPGFSLLLAPLRVVGGRDAIFLLTPVAGALLVWLTFAAGRRIAGDGASAAAAIVLATTPVFLFQVVQPMNDVTVAALWTAVIALAARAAPSSAAIGAITGLAVLVRPNLAPLAVPVLVWELWTARRSARPWRELSLFALCLTPFIAMTAAMNEVLYDHALSSGYGNSADLFSLAHIPSNLRNYGSALLRTQLGFPLLGLAAPFVVPKHVRPIAWLISAMAAAAACTYLLYTPYAEWWYLRFFLPVLPALIVLAMAVVVQVSRRTFVSGLVMVLLVGVALTSDAARQVLALQRLEARFRTTGDLVRERLPEKAVYLTVWESGTVKYHAGREAVLWDSLDPEWLDRAIEWLSSRGLEPFIVLEEWEEPGFRQRFGSHSTFGNVDWPPRFDVDRQVRIFSPRDRARYMAGESIPTTIVRTDRR
jgi:Dolichyl-phosphate-mannose-protein mannosyltransferase